MKSFILKIIFRSLLVLLPSLEVAAQQTVTPVDSTLQDRLDVIEKKLAYKKTGEEHIMIVGLTTFGFVSNKTTTTFNGVKTISKTNSLADANHYEFSPMFLWRHGNNLLLEFEPSFSNGQVGINWADVSYFLTPGVIVRAGYLVLPFGIYNKRLAAGWINKLAIDPIGVSSLPPLTDYGVEVEGGIQAGNMKFNYDVALSNGLQLLPDGTLQTAGITDNNKNKNFTGRIGWLPFSNSCLELGFSIMNGKVGDMDSKYQNTNGLMHAFDFNFIKNLKVFQINIKGQYNVLNINRAFYVNPTDSTLSYSFTNHTTSGFIQASARPMFAENKIVKNFELAGRYGNLITPLNSIGGSKTNEFAVGLDYWLNWRTVLKFTYQNVNNTNTGGKDLGASTGALIKSNSMYLQFSVQL